MTRTLTGLLVAIVLFVTPRTALALIEGAEGNERVTDRRLPKGADAIVNRPDRIAWWEGDGGPFHADGRADTDAMNKIVSDFAKLDVKTKRIVVHDGIGQSYLINMDMQSEIIKEAKIDWTFSVWPKGKWESSIRRFTRPNQPPPEKPDLPAQIDVYTDKIRWADVVVPPGIEVIDERLEAHGFTFDDDIVIQGQIKALPGKTPIIATVRAQEIGIKEEGGYEHTDLAETKSNEAGNWVLKKLPAAWMRIVVEADGFAPRVIGYARFYDQPQWRSFDTELVPAVSVSGRVTDASGTPLGDVDIRLMDVNAEPGGAYESPADYQIKSDAEGRFRFEQVPAGKASLWLHKSGYSMGGLGPSITMPASGIEVQLIKAGSIRVTVDFEDRDPPNEYIVELEPEGGNAVGKYGGSAKIDAKNVYTFENVPPGKYVVKGHPNPTRPQQITEPVKVDLERSNAAEVTIKAK